MSDGFQDFSFETDDDKVGKAAKRFKAEGGRTYRATFCWFSVKTAEGWDDSLAFKDGKLHPEAQIRFTGCERIYKEGVGYFLYNGPTYAQFGAPKQAVGTIICVWPTDKDGDLDASSFANGKGHTVQPWVFSPDKYNTIKKSHKRFTLMAHDMAMSCPADGGQYQKLTFTPENENLLQKLLASEKPQFKEVAAQIILDAKAVAEKIQGDMARNMTLDQIREAMGEEVGTPTGSSHEAKDVEDLLNDVL